MDEAMSNKRVRARRELQAEMKDRDDIYICVICGRPLKVYRVHTDTCGERCYRALLRLQRGGGT